MNLVEGLYVGFAVLWCWMNIIFRPEHVHDELSN